MTEFRRRLRRWRREGHSGLWGTVGLAAAGLVVVALAAYSVIAVQADAPSPGEARALPLIPSETPTPSPSPTAKPINVSIPDGQPLRAMWIGDSLTKGVGASVRAKTYQNLMIAEFKKAARVDVQTAAISGADEGRVIESIATIPPDLNLAIVELGTNDATRTPLPQFRERYKALLAMVREASPDAVLLCAGTWRPFDEAAPYDPVIRSECKAAKGRYVPLTDLFDQEDTRGPEGRKVYPGESVDPVAKIGDLFHPNDIGYREIADRMLAQVELATS